MKIKGIDKLKLYDFNNLTKSLSFNIYDICYAKSYEHRQDYIRYIDEQYNATRLTEILTNVTHIIGANVLNIAQQDYDPQGASVTMLIAEGPVETLGAANGSARPGPDAGQVHKESVVGHLDKSHITVHTYPESHPDKGVSTFRADIDVSTCGQISPLKALNYLIKSFESDIIIMDYRVRGFTRDMNGKKCFIDHKINSIQNYLPAKTRNQYQMIDVNIYQENIFHTKMILREFDLDNYLFDSERNEFDPAERKKIKKKIKKEMSEIFYGRNMVNV
ncbi:adenosylmethionine decarboxylase [Anoxynatronum buryatiense]|uniref:S-adenosylmethionine decarboxylase proenzyme n=1 Tax=Anoxynatronum buryatiense TaxID=489973 RepID=A0AA45WXM6_9CLOT|nr:adenosylmethionine decarboxylase [Anoxynatronum buryatiense]SMP65063.1 S-adenosylmethionine decarboxylase [Anoxynatronum buryatiense]